MKYLLVSMLLIASLAIATNAKAQDDLTSATGSKFVYDLVPCGYYQYQDCCCGDGNQYIIESPTYRIECVFGGVWECNDANLGDCLPSPADCQFLCPGQTLCA